MTSNSMKLISHIIAGGEEKVATRTIKTTLQLQPRCKGMESRRCGGGDLCNAGGCRIQLCIRNVLFASCFLSFLGWLVAFDPARNWRQPQEQPTQQMQQQQMVPQQYNLTQLSSYEPEKRTFWCVLWLWSLVFGWYIPYFFPSPSFCAFSSQLFLWVVGIGYFVSESIIFDYDVFLHDSVFVLVRYV